MATDWMCTGSLLVLAAWLLWRYLSWNYRHWQSLGVPCLEPSVPFGNVSDAIFGKKSMGEVITEIYRKMEGEPFCGFYRFRAPVLLVRDAFLVRAMLVKDFQSFHDNNVDIDEKIDPLAGRNPFVLKGERWRKTRSQLSPSFTASRLKPMFGLMKEVCDDLVEVIKKEAPASEPDGLDTVSLCTRYTTDVVASVAMGIKGGTLKDPRSKMMEVATAIIQPSLLNSIKFIILFASPTLSKLLRLRFFPAEVERFFSSVVSENVAQRQQMGIHREDYLQMLIELKEKGYLDSTGQVLREKIHFSDLDITAQVVTFMTDGIATSASTMSFVLYDLAMNPDVQQRLRKELQESVSRHGGQLCYDVIQEATYLDMVFSETMRIHPAVSIMEKRCTAPYPLQTESGRRVELQPGSSVVVAVMGMHKDPRYFPDPDRYDPERFSPDNKDLHGTKAYIPFGLGPRSCIGQRFAVSQVKMGVAAVVLELEICRTPRTPVTIVQDPNNILTAAMGGVWLTFKPLR